MPYTIDPKYRLGIETVDSEHAELIHIVEELKSNVTSGKCDEHQLQSIVARLLKYTHTHFSHEEQLMYEYHYPQLAEHRAKHAELMAQVEQFAQDLGDHAKRVALQINLFMNVWLYEHISKDDAAYAKYILADAHPKT
jgi:hemerythrin